MRPGSPDPVKRAFLTTAAVLAAIPFGWMAGAFVAELIVGPEMGVFPVLTIPPVTLAAIVFALSPALSPGKRLAILIIGGGLMVLLA